MQCLWIMSVLCTLVSMALLMFVVGQHAMLTTLKEEIKVMITESEKLDKERENREFFNATLVKLQASGTEEIAALEAVMAAFAQLLEKKETDKNACLEDKKTKNDELAATLKEQTETEATIKAEAAAWETEINTLKGQLTEYRPICDHVKRNPLPMQLCGQKPTQHVQRVALK